MRVCGLVIVEPLKGLHSTDPQGRSQLQTRHVNNCSCTVGVIDAAVKSKNSMNLFDFFEHTFHCQHRHNGNKLIMIVFH